MTKLLTDSSLHINARLAVLLLHLACVALCKQICLCDLHACRHATPVASNDKV